MTIEATQVPLDDAQALAMAEAYPAYWKPIPQHWQAIDTYRIDDLFPLTSSRLYHARKKLLVPGCRTGGKSVYDDIREAYTTLGAWLADNKALYNAEKVEFFGARMVRAAKRSEAE